MFTNLYLIKKYLKFELKEATTEKFKDSQPPIGSF